MGGAGDDSLFGGDGNDKIDGGDGNDRIVAGNGNNITTGGAGNDIFAFRINSTGTTEILDFDMRHDKLGVILKHGDQIPNELQKPVATPNGARIRLSENSFILLRNIDAAALNADQFISVQ